jgi:hypothetical protein
LASKSWRETFAAAGVMPVSRLNPQGIQRQLDGPKYITEPEKAAKVLGICPETAAKSAWSTSVGFPPPPKVWKDASNGGFELLARVLQQYAMLKEVVKSSGDGEISASFLLPVPWP